MHYFPGMWSWDRAIVEPLVLAAYDRAGGPAERAAAARTASCAGRGTSTALTPVRVDVDVDVHVPDPVLPDTHLATRKATPCATATASTSCWSTTTTGTGSASTAWSTSSPPTTSSRLDERDVLACWAWEEIELATTIAGIQYTELRRRPAGVPALRDRADATPRRRARRAGSGVAVSDMLDARPRVEPTPAW